MTQLSWTLPLSDWLLGLGCCSLLAEAVMLRASGLGQPPAALCPSPCSEAVLQQGWSLSPLFPLLSQALTCAFRCSPLLLEAPSAPLPDHLLFSSEAPSSCGAPCSVVPSDYCVPPVLSLAAGSQHQQYHAGGGPV